LSDPTRGGTPDRQAVPGEGRRSTCRSATRMTRGFSITSKPCRSRRPMRSAVTSRSWSCPEKVDGVRPLCAPCRPV